MRAGRGDFKHALRLRLSSHIREIEARGGHNRQSRRNLYERRNSGQVRTDRKQRRRAEDRRVTHERCFGSRRRRKHERAPVGARRARHGQRTADRSQVAGERQFAREFIVGQLMRRDLAGRGQDAERDRQIEASGFLAQVRRRQVDRHLARRKLRIARFCNAARTRSRASRTSASGKPTRWIPGNPPAMCTSTATRGAPRRRRARGCAGSRPPWGL